MTPEALISDIQKAFPGLLAFYVFGSRAKGESTPESDLDLAILVEGYADPGALWDVSSQLAERANTEVDLLDLRAASTVMQYQVITGGRRLWAQDGRADLFESFILSEKTDLDERRAGLLADIYREGRIYG